MLAAELQHSMSTVWIAVAGMVMGGLLIAHVASGILTNLPQDTAEAVRRSVKAN